MKQTNGAPRKQIEEALQGARHKHGEAAFPQHIDAIVAIVEPILSACTCGAPELTHESAEDDCVVHGAVRALNDILEESNENMRIMKAIRRQRDEAEAALGRVRQLADDYSCGDAKDVVPFHVAAQAIRRAAGEEVDPDWFFFCKLCNKVWNTGSTPAKTLDVARAEARKAGWSLIEGRDVCPDHPEQK